MNLANPLMVARRIFLRSQRLRAAIATLMFAITPMIPVREIPDLEEAPLWELGVGGGGTYTPDYPGSNQSHVWAIPFPFLVYRGDILHSDRRGGTRARLLQSEGYELNVSSGGALPSNSSHNTAREGMPNLEWLGEFGPRLTIDLMANSKGSSLRLGLPLRAAFTTDFKRYRDAGYVFAPELLLDMPRIFGGRVDAFSLLTVNFADRRFQNYFYAVDPEFARPGRPAYSARGGYFQSDISLGITVPVPALSLKIFTYASLQSLKGAVNENSPLVKTNLNSTVSLVLIWVFGKSERTVFTDD